MSPLSRGAVYTKAAFDSVDSGMPDGQCLFLPSPQEWLLQIIAMIVVWITALSLCNTNLSLLDSLSFFSLVIASRMASSCAFKVSLNRSCSAWTREHITKKLYNTSLVSDSKTSLKQTSGDCPKSLLYQRSTVSEAVHRHVARQTA